MGQCIALVALFAVVGINTLYLAVHVISEHHGLKAVSALFTVTLRPRLR